MKLNTGITLALAIIISIALTWFFSGALTLEKFAGKKELHAFEENFARLQNAVETLRREQHLLAQQIKQLHSLQSTVAAYHADLYGDAQGMDATNPIVGF